MTHFVEFNDDGMVMYQQIELEVNNDKTQTFKWKLTIPLALVPKINQELEKVGLPSLYQWLSHGFNLQIIIKLQLASVGAVFLEDELETQALNLLRQTSKQLTGEETLGRRILEIMRSHIFQQPMSEQTVGAINFKANWESLYNHLKSDFLN